MDFEVAWPVGLSIGAVSALALFVIAKRGTSQSPNVRRTLFAVASVLGFSTAIPVALTAIFFTTWAGYCEDAGFCMPKWWVFVGVSLFGAFIALFGLAVRATQEFRRVV
jgi:hypothetical protein